MGCVTSREERHHTMTSIRYIDEASHIYLSARDMMGERKEILYPISTKYQVQKDYIVTSIYSRFTSDGVRVRVRWFDEIEPQNPSQITSYVRVIFE
jgi:hypothetical protein